MRAIFFFFLSGRFFCESSELCHKFFSGGTTRLIGTMYARYVPPKKEAKAKADVSSTTQNIDRKSGLYARYVPPPKPTPTPSQKIVFEADEDDAEEERRPTKKLKIDVSPLEKAPKPKERKEKKEKKSKARKSTDSGTKDTTDTRDEVVTTDPLIADVQTTRESPEGALPSDRREKKRRRKTRTTRQQERAVRTTQPRSGTSRF